MKKIFIIANWKANKNSAEAFLWMQEFLSKDFSSWFHRNSPIHEVKKIIVLCPPATLLAPLHALLSSTKSSLPIKIGAQDVSSFPGGAYTGEESAAMLKEFADYVIIGHSERREAIGETGEVLSRKVSASLSQQLEPIFCIQDVSTFIPDYIKIVAYEPISAIGSGNPQNSKEANEVARIIKEKKEIPYVLYGGSVNSKNVKEFTKQPYLDGVLIGSASLDPHEFSSIIQNA